MKNPPRTAIQERIDKLVTNGRDCMYESSAEQTPSSDVDVQIALARMELKKSMSSGDSGGFNVFGDLKIYDILTALRRVRVDLLSHPEQMRFYKTPTLVDLAVQSKLAEMRFNSKEELIKEMYPSSKRRRKDNIDMIGDCFGRKKRICGLASFY